MPSGGWFGGHFFIVSIAYGRIDKHEQPAVCSWCAASLSHKQVDKPRLSCLLKYAFTTTRLDASRYPRKNDYTTDAAGFDGTVVARITNDNFASFVAFLWMLNSGRCSLSCPVLNLFACIRF